jgi:hypothetical protein
MEGSSKSIGEQITIGGGSKDMEELLTMEEQIEIDILHGFNDAKNEESNHEEVVIDDGGIGHESLTANCDSSDSYVKVSKKHIKKTSKKSLEYLLMRKILHLKVMGPSLVVAISLNNLD